MPPTVMVIGVGNAHRQDDAVGVEVVNRLRKTGLPPCAIAAVSDGEPARLVELWARSELAIVVDALALRFPSPGAIHRLTLDSVERSHRRSASSHGLGLGTAVRLARELDRLPGRLIVYAVEIGDFAFGNGMSTPVIEAADHVVEHVLKDIAEHMGEPTPKRAAPQPVRGRRPLR